MMHTVTAAWFAMLVLLAQGALAQQVASKSATADPAGSLHGALGKAAPQARRLLDIIKLAPNDVPNNTVGTFFIPNDAAVAAFLKSMGYTADDLAAKHNLVDLILSYHFIPGYQVTGDEVGKGPKRAATGDDNYIVTLDKNSEGLLTVKDVQGNTASVVSGPVKVGKVYVYTVDKVLMSGNYFTDTLAALKFYPSWVTTNGLAQRTGVDKALAASKAPYTLFVPQVKAWKPLEPTVKVASKEQVADMLQYHVVPGALQVPQDFKDGSLATLLQGQSLKVKVNATATGRDPFKGGAEVVEPLVELTPAVGQPAKVVTYNIYAGKNMIHAIDGVLQPGATDKAAPAPTAAAAPKAPAAAAPKAPAKVTTEAATKAPPATATSSGPKPAAATPALKAAAATPAPKAAAASSSTPQPTTQAAPKGAAAAAAAKPSPKAAVAHNAAAAATAAAKTAAATSSMVTTATPAPKSPAAVAGRRLRALAPQRWLLQDDAEEDAEEEVKPPEGITVGRTVEIGSLQTSPNGFVSTRLQEALDAAATGEVPIQYTNRFGSLPVSSAADGCLNCFIWAKP